MVIVFEWIDGCGKDTQLNLAIAQIKAYNKYSNILVTREPSLFSKSGKKIKKLLKKGFKSNKQALKLYTKNRIEMAETIQEIKNAFPNLVVVSSRSELSTLAYQSSSNTFFEDIIKLRKNIDKKGVFKPADITILLKVDPDTAMNRIELRGENKDVFETVEILKKKQDKYLEAAKFLEEEEGQRIFIVDANGSVEDVAYKIKKILDNFFDF